MKRITLAILVLTSLIAVGQDYNIISSNTQKIFSEFSVPENSYSLSIEYSNLVGIDSIYYNYFKRDSDYYLSDSCEFWGGNECNKQNMASWIGKNIKSDNDNSYTFSNIFGDFLEFTFDNNSVNPSLFFADNNQEFYTVFESVDTLSYLGITDSVKKYRIFNLDLSGDTIFSELHNFSILVAKQSGLLTFFQIDSFPLVQKPLALIGDQNTGVGFYKLSNEMVYDFYPGNVFQYKETSNYNDIAPPWYFYERYRKLEFISREETTDSLIYEVIQELFYVDSTGVEIDTIVIKYLKNAIISNIPFEKFNGNSRNLQLVDYCDELRWTYSTIHKQDDSYCEVDTCWGTVDVFGPPDVTTNKYVCGLGNSLYKVTKQGPDGYSIGSSLIYHKKGEVICGEKVVVGIHEKEKAESMIIISPNPASNVIKISSINEIKHITISSLSGVILIEKLASSKCETLQLNKLSDGIYIVRVELRNGDVVAKKMLVRN